MSDITRFIDELEDRYSALADARRVMAEAEEMALRSKAALTTAERELDELRFRLQAEAPDECRNEVQRRAFAQTGSRDLAERVEGLRAAHLESEVRVLWAKEYLRNAEDTRRFLETIAQAVAQPELWPVLGRSLAGLSPVKAAAEVVS